MGCNTTPMPRVWPSASFSDSEPSIVFLSCHGLPSAAVTGKSRGAGG